MSVEPHESVMDRDAAERLTNRITLMAGTIREGVEKLATLVQQAKNGNAHVALGYASWTAYLSDVLGREPIRLDAPQRRELVSYLSGEGMSTRAIAPIVGVSHETVRADAGVKKLTPAVPVDRETGEIAETSGAESVAVAPEPVAGGRTSAEPTETPAPESTKVTGLDGKTYSRPEPRAARQASRRPITDAFTDATYDLLKVIERIERLVADDRFPQNAEKVAQRNRGDLLRANDSLTGVIASLTNESGV